MDQAAIKKCVKLWQKRLGLSSWTIELEFSQIEWCADCAAYPEYLNAKIRFDTGSDIDEATIIHELLHCHIEGLAHLAEKLAGTDERWKEMVRIEEERLATNLEKIFTQDLS